MRIWGRVVLGGIAALASSFVIAIPAGAALSHSGVSDTCPEVLAGSPTGGVKKVTVPVDGGEVRRGDVVAVTLRWDTATFTSPVLPQALDCVTIDGALDDRLQFQERDTANDGRFETHFTVPSDLADGTRLCDRGFVSGPGGDNGFAREKSNDVCFTVRGDIPATVPAPAENLPAPVAPKRPRRRHRRKGPSHRRRRQKRPMPLRDPSRQLVDGPRRQRNAAPGSGRRRPRWPWKAGQRDRPGRDRPWRTGRVAPHGLGDRRIGPPGRAVFAPRRVLPARQPEESGGERI